MSSRTPHSTSAYTSRAYRLAFEDFARSARRVQALKAQANADRSEVDAALLELEKARVFYNKCRDGLFEHLRSDAHGKDNSPLYQTARVQEIAQLRWESNGKPNGTADEDWYKAEEIVRRAQSATSGSEFILREPLKNAEKAVA
jgi:hypothetical protein